MYKLIAAMVIPLLGCAAKTEYIFTFHGRSEDFAAVEMAAHDWNSCNVINITIIQQGDGDVDIEHVDDSFSDKEFCDPKVRGITLNHKLIEYKSTDPNIQRTLTHEMGHALGLGHSPTGIMKLEDPSNSVSPSDCEALRER